MSDTELLKEEKIEPGEDITAGTSYRQLPHVRRRLSESIFPFSNPDSGTEFDDKYFRQVGAGNGTLDLPPAMLSNAQRLSMLLYRKNVRAYRSVENLKDFVVGDGVKFMANDPRVQAVLDEHWEQNSWTEKLPERLRALSIFGEQLYPAFRDETTGLVRIGAIVPFRIQQVNTDPGNADELVSVTVYDSISNSSIPDGTSSSRSYDIIRRENMDPKKNPTFYWAVNRVSGSTRGVPDSLASVDWFEGTDGATFSLMERMSVSENVVFDLKYEGLNPVEIRKRVNDFGEALRSGGIFGHNEKVELSIKTPNLGASDAETVLSVLLRQIQAGTGFAGMYYGDSADLTRASASELAVPVAKMIQSRQDFVKQSISLVFDYQIQSSIAAGVLDGVTDFSYDIGMARVYLRDTSQETQSLVNITNSLIIARDAGWVTDEQAKGVYMLAIERLGPLVAVASSSSQA